MAESKNETMVTIKLWAVIAVIIAAFGILYQSQISHENRITKLETQITQVVSGVGEVKEMQQETLKDIKTLSKQIIELEAHEGRK